jgi:hypothetical protein
MHLKIMRHCALIVVLEGCDNPRQDTSKTETANGRNQSGKDTRQKQRKLKLTPSCLLHVFHDFMFSC